MQRFTTGDGLSLSYQDEPGGPGAPLLCLAGLTRSVGDFDHFAAAMKGRRRVIRLDCRGRGASDYDPDHTHYNALTEAGDALALLDHLGVDKVVVIGSSRGGILGMVIAATRPERLAGVVLNDVGPAIDPVGMKKIAGYIGVTPRARNMGEAAGMVEAFNREAFTDVDERFWLDWAERSFVVTEKGLALNYDPKLRDATMEQMSEIDPAGPGLWPIFEALEPIPTLVLRGANSDLLSPATVAEMRVRKPDILSAEIPGRGHIPRLDEPASLEAINAFLDGLDD